MNCCLVREYIQANDKYIDLSIGNAPWPMGIAMLSITVKRNAPKVSHVLDEEMSRKWMQTIKRFISVSQELYPSHDDNKKVGYSIKTAI
jgi:pre-mRNA-splicing factor 18